MIYSIAVPKQIKDFPLIMIHSKNGIIILVTHIEERGKNKTQYVIGTILRGNPIHDNVGKHTEDYLLTDCEEFKGQLIMSNDKT